MQAISLFLVVILCFVSNYQIQAQTNRKLDNASSTCIPISPCIHCNKEELEHEYCKTTGRRIRMRCKDSNDNSEYDHYESCEKTAEDDQIQVIIFQVIMGIVGALAYWGVQSRKKNTMTLFETRKLRK